MDRTQKKCFVGVTVMHALLVLIAVIGTAFFNKDEKIVEDRPQILELINPNVTDGKTRGGAQAAISAEDVKLPEPAQAKPTLPEPIPQQPEPEPQPVVEQPRPKPVEPEKTVPELPAPIKKPLPKPVSLPKPTPKVAVKSAPTKPTRNIDIGKPTVRHASDQKASAAAAEKADRDARLKVAASLKGAVSRLGQNLSSSTTIDLQGGTDAGAVNYGDLVLKKYDDAWTAPNEVDDNVAIAKARVVIARSGNVISSEIIKGSGNAILDKSVRRALDSVRFIHAFPEGSKDSQRTYIINFNLKMKRGIG